MYFVYSVIDNEVIGPYSLIDMVDFILPGILVCDEQSEVWEYSENIPEIQEVLSALGLLKENEESLPAGFFINASGEIIRENVLTPIPRTDNYRESTQEPVNNDNKKSYTGWIVFFIFIIIVIVIANN